MTSYRGVSVSLLLLLTHRLEGVSNRIGNQLLRDLDPLAVLRAYLQPQTPLERFTHETKILGF